MKKLLTLAIVLVMSIYAVACAGTPDNGNIDASQAASGTYQTIKPEDVKKMMDNGDDMVLVDVRTAGEYNSARLEGAINIPVETISDKKPAELPDVDAKIILYCRSGARSAVAAQALIALGYTAVYDMGGIIDWPYDTVSASGPTPTEASDALSDGILSTFTSTAIDGNPVDAAIFSGSKLTMVNIWATFCTPCIEEMPDLGKLNTQYADKGFQIVGIIADAADGDGAIIENMVDLAREIVDATGADYLHILPSADINRLLLGNVTAVPTTIFVDDGGKQIGEAYVGSRTGDEWASIIDNLLKEV